MGRNAKLIGTEVAGALLSMVCCLTPLLVVLFGAVGLAGYVAKLDYVLIPAFVASIALITFALVRCRRACVAAGKDTRQLDRNLMLSSGSICTLFIVSAIALYPVGTTYGNDPDSNSWQLEQIEARIVATNGGRWTTVQINDSQERRCPQFTALIASVRDRLQLVAPNYALYGPERVMLPVQPLQGTFSEKGSQPYSRDLVIFTEECGYRLTIARFDFVADAERRVRLKGFLEQYRGTLQAVERRSIAKSGLDGEPVQHDEVVADREGRLEVKSGLGAWRMHDDEFAMDRIDPDRMDRIDPKRRGTSEFDIDFDSPEKPIEFSGILYFGPQSFSAYLVNVAADLSIESRKKPDIGVHELDVRNAGARIRLDVTKEVRSNGFWIKAPGK
jgi:mercuric ion transport protein